MPQGQLLLLLQCFYVSGCEAELQHERSHLRPALRPRRGLPLLQLLLLLLLLQRESSLKGCSGRNRRTSSTVSFSIRNATVASRLDVVQQ
jgi:hypothetical protein